MSTQKTRLVGAITIGQAPRVDITNDITATLAPSIELVERGALDGLTLAEVERKLAPEFGNEVLVSRMRDGNQATVSGEKVMPLVQERIYELEQAGTEAIILLCTGQLPAFEHRVPLIYPQPLLYGTARALAGEAAIAVMVPEAAQLEQAKSWWSAAGVKAHIVCASPYGSPERIEEAARSLRGSGCALIALDCMGFSRAMRNMVRDASGIDVLLPRTLVASIVSELLG